MRKKIIAFTLFVALCITMMGNVSYAQDNMEQDKIAEKAIEAKWMLKDINFDKSSPQQISEEINISAEVENESTYLLYKYVWMKNDWQEWGVIRDFSDEKKVSWQPKTSGKYHIYVDVKEPGKNPKSLSKEYIVEKNKWNYNDLLPQKTELKKNKKVVISTELLGNKKGLQYKYVWMKNDWKEWGIIRDFSEENEVSFKPDKLGKFTVLVNVKDQNGDVITRSKEYNVKTDIWNYDDIVTNYSSPQEKYGKPITISARTSGEIESLQYKFVWMKNDWKEWGIIQNLSKENVAKWEPKSTGKYTIYVDVKDRDGETRIKALDYFVATQLWEPENIVINENVEEQIYTKIPIEASASGDTENLQYKFVWKKGATNDDWGKEWGVIQEFGCSNRTDKWYPKKPGIYTIYVDIKDLDGRKKTITKEYEVLEPSWKLDKLEIDGSLDRFVGDTLKVEAKTSGITEGLQYKFVCRRGSGWEDWEVIRDFSPNNQIEIPIAKDKEYNIYVDIKDNRGVTFDAEIIKVRGHKYMSVKSSSTIVSKGQTINIYPDVTGEKGELQYKYVWQKNNWQNWGVIQEFSTSSSVDWTPKEPGIYYISVDIKANGKVQTKNVKIEVTNTKTGWYYERGYKFYYKNGVKQLDLDGILPKQSNYYIKVNRSACTVTVYAKDGNNGYIIPVKRFACSVGKPNTPTPTGTFYTSSKYRWHTLMGPSYGQYCTRITKNILFHSVAGVNMTSHNLNAKDYNMLGQPASHGCVRLCVRDAKWIYDNCSPKTQVTIYDSSNPGPLGKQSTIKIPLWQNWDPTDPNA